MATPCHRSSRVPKFPCCDGATDDGVGEGEGESRGPTGLRALFETPPRWLSRTVRGVTAVELGIGVAALLLIFFLVLVQAAQRYLPVDGWSWTGELARFALVWLTFVVAGVLVTRTPTSPSR